MATITSFTDLIVWQKAHKLALDVYKETEKFPRQEVFGLTSQVRRAAVSVVSNIVEGFERKSAKEFEQFLGIARGSIAEVQSQLLLAKDLGYLSVEVFDRLAAQTIEVHKLLNGLTTSVRRKRLLKTQV